jgi:gas vesicle protein
MHDDVFDRQPFVVIERDEPGIGTLLLGVAIGAGLAMLFAPRSGADTRRMIGGGARRAGDRVKGVASEIADNVASQASDVRDRVNDRVGATRDAIRRGQEQVLDAVDAGRYAASEAKTELERRIAENKAARRGAKSL